jgi:hypothetical protein
MEEIISIIKSNIKNIFNECEQLDNIEIILNDINENKTYFKFDIYFEFTNQNNNKIIRDDYLIILKTNDGYLFRNRYKNYSTTPVIYYNEINELKDVLIKYIMKI